MSRRPNVERSRRINLAIPQSEWAWLNLHLFSFAEQRIPHAAYQKFFLARLREYRERVTNRVLTGNDSTLAAAPPEVPGRDLHDGGHDGVRGDSSHVEGGLGSSSESSEGEKGSS